MLGPIFNRECLTVPRRGQHFVSRVVYLGVLWILALTAWQATVGWNRTSTLYETGRFGPLLFHLAVLVQIVLLIFFSALTAAGAVNQEKDRRTFILLLLTDLRNQEIVLGKLLGSLLPIGVFLLATMPLLLMVTFLGGVAPFQVFLAMGILAGTALAAASLGTLMALWRDKTFQALALTVLVMVLYFFFIRGIPIIFSWITGEVNPEAFAYIQSCFDPFLALDALQQPSAATDILPPALGYLLGMLLLSTLLNAWSLARLRVWNPSGELIQQREVPDEETETKRDIHAAPGKVRKVGPNPILWREIFTRAYGRRPLLVKIAYFVVFGLVSYYSLAPLLQGEEAPRFAAAYGLVPIGILSLLLVAAQAATAITSERDLGSLDLLLVTDLSPKEVIFGKLWGILYNVKEYIIPPLLLLSVYAWLGLLATPPEAQPQLRPAMNFEGFICILGIGLVMLSFTIVLGVHVSLRIPNSRQAILSTLSTVFFLSVGTLVCIYLILINGRFEYQWTSFLIFTVAGVGGLGYVLNGNRPSTALLIAAWLCPFAVLYCVMNVLVGKPGTQESADPLIPFMVIATAFGFTIAGMVIPLISEFDVALGRARAEGD